MPNRKIEDRDAIYAVGWLYSHNCVSSESNYSIVDRFVNGLQQGLFSSLHGFELISLEGDRKKTILTDY